MLPLDPLFKPCSFSTFSVRWLIGCPQRTLLAAPQNTLLATFLYILWSQVRDFSNYAANAVKFTLMLDILNFIIWIYCLFLQLLCVVYSWLFNESYKSCTDTHEHECSSLILWSYFIFLCEISCSFHCCLSFGMQLRWSREEVCKKLARTYLEK
jgi:hypothetical protein